MNLSNKNSDHPYFLIWGPWIRIPPGAPFVFKGLHVIFASNQAFPCCILLQLKPAESRRSQMAPAAPCNMDATWDGTELALSSDSPVMWLGFSMSPDDLLPILAMLDAVVE